MIQAKIFLENMNSKELEKQLNQFLTEVDFVTAVMSAETSEAYGKLIVFYRTEKSQ